MLIARCTQYFDPSQDDLKKNQHAFEQLLAADRTGSCPPGGMRKIRQKINLPM